jgi:hypothetical protein
MAHLPA